MLEGFCWSVGEACVGEACGWRIAPTITWVAHLTAFPICALSNPSPVDARGRRRSRSAGVSSTLGRVSPFSLVYPDSPRFHGARTNSCSGYAAMVSQLGRSKLASLPTPVFGAGAAAVNSHRLAPHNVRSDGVTRLSSAGAQVVGQYPTIKLGTRKLVSKRII